MTINEVDSIESQNKEAFWLKATAQLRLFVLLPSLPHLNSLDYVPPEVVSPEKDLLGFFLTEAPKRTPYREPH